MFPLCSFEAHSDTGALQALTLPVVTVYILFRKPALLRQLDPRPRLISQNDDLTELDPSTLLYRRPTYTAWLIWLRSLLTSGGLCFLYAGLSRAALSEIITVLSTRAFIIGFLCWLFLREAFGWRLRLASGMCEWTDEVTAKLITIVISCFAVVLIVQPMFLFGTGPNLDIDASTRILGSFFRCLASFILDALESELSNERKSQR